MFMQSAAMALGFGSFFQYGKRKISSMSNEEFNALTPEALTAQLLSNVNNMIPSVQSSFKQMEQMNVLILDAMANYFSQGVAKLDQWIRGRGENLLSNLTPPPQTSTAGAGDTEFLHNFGIGAAAAEYIPPADLRNLGAPLPVTFGPIGPQQPKMDSFYVRMSLHTRYTMWKTNSATWKRIPSVQKILIIKSLKNYKPETVTSAISRTTTQGSVVQQIATAYNNIGAALTQWKTAPSNNAFKKLFLGYMKVYNRLVTLNRKPQLQVDTRLSLLKRKIIAKS